MKGEGAVEAPSFQGTALSGARLSEQDVTITHHRHRRQQMSREFPGYSLACSFESPGSG